MTVSVPVPVLVTAPAPPLSTIWPLMVVATAGLMLRLPAGIVTVPAKVAADPLVAVVLPTLSVGRRG